MSEIDEVREQLRRPPAWGPNERGEYMVDMTVEAYERDLDRLVAAARGRSPLYLEPEECVVLLQSLAFSVEPEKEIPVDATECSRMCGAARTRRRSSGPSRPPSRRRRTDDA